MKSGEVGRQVFTEDGGTIGRAATNSWVLTQNKVSGHHATISFRNGVFYIQDTSRNGVSINSPDNRLVRDRPYALKSGDVIFIEPVRDRGVDRHQRRAAALPAARRSVRPGRSVRAGARSSTRASQPGAAGGRRRGRSAQVLRGRQPDGTAQAGASRCNPRWMTGSESTIVRPLPSLILCSCRSRRRFRRRGGGDSGGLQPAERFGDRSSPAVSAAAVD